LPCSMTVAQRAARQLRAVILVVAALVVALAATATTPTPVDAATYAPRVVIVVGPSGSSTSTYLRRAKTYAGQARAYGASVVELYTPKATWGRVKKYAQGANILIYLGHGNGWPSPYPPYQGQTKDGLGLNPYSGSGTASPVKYYGEDQIASKIRLAPGAVVLLNHLCYASGNGESGAPNPSWSTARQRVDNFAAGFIRARAAAVLADAHSSLGNEIAYLFGASRSLLGAWRADPGANGNERSFSSSRSPGFGVHLDPDSASAGFYRSLVTRSGTSTRTIRIAALRGTTRLASTLRSGPSPGARTVTKVGSSAPLWVTGSISTDGAGRTWVPVITTTGARGYVAGWYATYTGSARTRTDLILRSAASTAGRRLATVRSNTRVTVVKSARDGRFRSWFYVRTSSGRTGWLAAWLMKP
jgi:hypothetical protein